MKYIASISFGKDSLAMLLLLLEKNYKIDEVIFFNTGMEFKAVYNIRDIIKDRLEEKQIKFTELKPQMTFIYKMLEKPVIKRDGTFQKGYGLCGGKCRWGTTDKNRMIEQYLREHYKDNYKEYIGIAYNENKRINKERKKHKIMPLVTWKMTERDTLQFCYQNGFDWRENGVRLYDILKRVSCWCCANKSKKELENMRIYLTDYYLKYIDILKKIKTNNKKGIVVDKARQQFLKLF